ncbi:hypothetical protein ACIQUG_22960 [Ensifer sp. NPDC090286]|uniref:hypothetical protein n=1 Tax=Ensifer sp. NPDC090286 TaxID=3363991 RepID=UPI00383AFB1A
MASMVPLGSGAAPSTVIWRQNCFPALTLPPTAFFAVTFDVEEQIGRKHPEVGRFKREAGRDQKHAAQKNPGCNSGRKAARFYLIMRVLKWPEDHR